MCIGFDTFFQKIVRYASNLEEYILKNFGRTWKYNAAQRRYGFMYNRHKLVKCNTYYITGELW